MSGIDEIDIMPTCEVCGHKRSYVILIREERHGYNDNRRYGRLDVGESAVGITTTRLYIAKNFIAEAERISIRDLTTDSLINYVNKLRQEKSFRAYGFRCSYCEYLYTRRRRKLFYLDLSTAVNICLRRGLVGTMSSYW